MAEQELHAVVYQDAKSGQWVASCVEYDITSSGHSEQHALEMIREAVELHLEDISQEAIEDIYNGVGSEPSIKKFRVRAPAILDH